MSEMDAPAREFLKRIINLEADMIKYIKDNAPRLKERIYFAGKNEKSLVSPQERYFLTPEGTVEVEMRKSYTDDYGKLFDFPADRLLIKYGYPILKTAVMKLGEELGKIPSEVE